MSLQAIYTKEGMTKSNRVALALDALITQQGYARKFFNERCPKVSIVSEGMSRSLLACSKLLARQLKEPTQTERHFTHYSRAFFRKGLVKLHTIPPTQTTLNLAPWMEKTYLEEETC